jgi:hypothetical protein
MMRKIMCSRDINFWCCIKEHKRGTMRCLVACSGSAARKIADSDTEKKGIEEEGREASDETVPRDSRERGIE